MSDRPLPTHTRLYIRKNGEETTVVIPVGEIDEWIEKFIQAPNRELGRIVRTESVYYYPPLNESAMARFIVTGRQLLDLADAAADPLESIFDALESCMKIQFPHMENLKYGIVTSMDIDAMIELQRDVFPLESDLNTPDDQTKD